MAANSEIILNSTSHPNDSTSTTLTGEKFKGAGYYGFGNSSHTVEVEITSFIGIIKIQATLAADPSSNDWFDVSLLGENSYSVDTTGLITANSSTVSSITYTTVATNAKAYNFIGNFTWVRVVIEDWTHGTINRVLLNH